MARYSKEEKEEFIRKMKVRTKQFAIDVIHFSDTLPKTQACRTISFQLIKAATSTGANYRASCRARSKSEFHSKISITVEEIDESEYWLEVVEGSEIACNQTKLKRLLKEAEEILKVVSTARKNNT